MDQGDDRPPVTKITFPVRSGILNFMVIETFQSAKAAAAGLVYSTYSDDCFEPDSDFISLERSIACPLLDRYHGIELSQSERYYAVTLTRDPDSSVGVFSLCSLLPSAYFPSAV